MFRARAIAFGCWLLFAAGIFLLKDDALRPLLFIPFMGFGGSMLYILFFVKCPKCGTPLGQAMGSMSKPNFCPGCGVGFDRRA